MAGAERAVTAVLLALPLDAAPTAVMRTRTADEWAAFAAANDLPVAAVRLRR